MRTRYARDLSRINYLNHRRRLNGGDGGDRIHGQKVVGAMPPSRRHRNFVMSVFLNSKMSHFLHVSVWFKPFAIKLNKLDNILRICILCTACFSNFS